MELHVLGPAFGLPSIDPECIAAVALLHRLLPPEQWFLVASYNGAQGSIGDLPAVSDGNSIQPGGFRNTVKHLQSRGHDLDQDFTPSQQADKLKLLSHLQLNALPLLDAHLYADPYNYTSTTRPAYSRILPFPYTFLSPPRRVNTAIARAQPLGLTLHTLSERDVTPEPSNPIEQEMADSTSPSLIFARGQKAQATLRQQASTARFRLEGAVDALCEPLDAMLRGGRTHLVADSLSSVDCLAFGYLALLLYPDVPRPWVTEVLRKRWKRVGAYADRLRNELFGGETFDAVVVMRHASADSHGSHPTPNALPWRTQAPPSLFDRLRAFSHSVLNLLIPPSTWTHLYYLIQPPSVPALTLLSSGSLLTVTTVVYAAVTLATSKNKPLGGPARYIFGRQPSVLAGMGEAGAILQSLRI